MSRHSRRARRRYANVYATRSRFGREPVPMLMYRDDDPLIVELIRGLWRVLWRYRSELVPLVVAFVVWNTGGWLHSVHPGWAVPIAVLGVVGCALALTYGRWEPRLTARVARLAPRAPGRLAGRPGWLVRPAERVYVAALIAAVGGWLASCAQWGTDTGYTATSAWLIFFGGAIPWWTHHRRRARVRVERTLEAWPELGQRIGLPMSTIQSAVIDTYGWTGRVVLSGGQTAADAIARIPAIESVLKTRPGAVRIEPDTARADHLIMRIIETDPHAQALPLPDGIASNGTAGVMRRSISGPLHLGLFEDATPVHLRVASRHILIGGVVGSGKSGVLNVFLAQLTGCVDAVCVGIDLKGGMELKPWAECMAWLATTPGQAVRLLGALVLEVDRRAATAATAGIRLWQPTVENPAVVIVIDEYAELSDEAKGLVDSIARRGRAVAITLLVATQRPTQAAMGEGAVRSQMDIRVSLRVRERRDADLILGQGMLAAGWTPHTLDAPGKFLLSSPEHTVPKPARAWLVDDDTVKDISDTNGSGLVRKLPLQWPPAAGSSQGADTKRKGTLEHTVSAPEERDPTVTAGELDAEASGREDAAQGTGGEAETPVQDAGDRVWKALQEVGPEGLSIPQLIDISGGMSRPWIYKRLSIHARAGEAAQVSRGRWRAAPQRATGQPGAD